MPAKTPLDEAIEKVGAPDPTADTSTPEVEDIAPVVRETPVYGEGFRFIAPYDSDGQRVVLEVVHHDWTEDGKVFYLVQRVEG